MHDVHKNFVDALRDWLPEEEIEPYLQAAQQPLKKSISLTTNKMSVEEFIATTRPRGWHLTPIPFASDAESFYIDREDTEIALGSTFLHQTGYFYIQEIAASLSAPHVPLHDGAIVLDMAASPGGKTSQLCNTLLGKQHPGLVVANDVDAGRIKTLAHNLNKWGCYNSVITKHNGFSFGKNLPNFFDHVLLDAPCSGEWTRFKSDTALAFWKQHEVNKIAGTQFQLLVSALKTVKPGGSVIYSTCTLNPYENEFIVQKALDFFGGDVQLWDIALDNVSPWLEMMHPEFSSEMQQKTWYDHEKMARLWPHRHGTWWFFIAHLHKRVATAAPLMRHHKLAPKNQFRLDSSNALQQRMATFLRTTYGITVDPKVHFFVASKEMVYLTSPAFQSIKESLHCEKVWIPVCKMWRNDMRPRHYLGNILWHLAQKGVVELNTDQAQAWIDGRDIDSQDVAVHHTAQDHPYKLLTRNKRGLSTAKYIAHNNVLKNKFMK